MVKSGRDENINPSIMTVHEVADYLRLSDATVYQMARSGRIPVFHMGRVWRFKRTEIEKWMESSEIEIEE
jgi:PTS system nitrogen regulatory IIA component